MTKIREVPNFRQSKKQPIFFRTYLERFLIPSAAGPSWLSSVGFTDADRVRAHADEGTGRALDPDVARPVSRAATMIRVRGAEDLHPSSRNEGL
jgi:hypothetical protein